MNRDNRFGSRTNRNSQARQIRPVITDSLIDQNRNGSQINNGLYDRRGRMRRYNDFIAAGYSDSLKREKHCVGAARNAHGMADTAIDGKLFFKRRKVGSVK